ncbi:hypothetical protein M0805_002947 [Coniferiporia weirii]|nr:hypothetical protein M0805_002947 [Coniferiporia weirii]
MFPTSLLAVLATCLSTSTVLAASNKALDVTFPDVPTSATNVVQDNFLGISWELFPVDYLWGQTTETMPNAMKNYLSNIRARMTNPLRIRIGGNSMDGSTYVPNQKDMITLPDGDAYYNDVPCDFGDLFFDVLNAMADTVGEMQFIIGLSMRAPSSDDNVVELAAAARAKFGDRLDAMLLGNEPDLYAGHGNRQGYTIQDYIPEIKQVLNDFENSAYGNITNTTIIGGPTVCCGWDLDDVLNAGLDELPYKYFTIQHYPTDVCSGVSASSSNITYYVSHANVAPFLRWNDAGIVIAKNVSVPMLLTEYNSASCGGDPSVAPTFAAGLWAVDTALQGAALNFTGMYLHTRELGVTYNLFDPPSEDSYQSAGWRTGAVYYAMLVLAEAISNTTSVVVDLNIDGSVSSYNATVAGYAVYDGEAHEKSKLVLFNYDYPRAPNNASDSNSTIEGTGRNTTQTFVLPANLTSSVGVRYFLAENITEETAITWAGQTVGSNGDLQGTQAMDTFDCKDGCSIAVPGPGLAVVWLDPTSDKQVANIYVGNSTIAGIYTGQLDATSGARRVYRSVEWTSAIGLAFGLIFVFVS